MKPVIYYQPEAYTTSGPKIMGRNAAGESFLRGFFKHSRSVELWAQVQQPAHGRHFSQTAKSHGRHEPVKIVDSHHLAALAEAGLVYFPGPGIGKHAFHRAAYGHGAWSLCGITHTTSSATAMDALADLITAPVQAWDAVICTSTAVNNNVERLLQAQVDHLKDRLGITRLVLPQLPVIPLGIHTQDFNFSEAQKVAARRSLAVDEGTLVVLFMGRLSFHAKAHPLAMYQALEQAALSTGKSVVLLECGWHANEAIANAYADAARLCCPHVRVVTLDGRVTKEREKAWAAADIFCSLSDNIQETFGIAPIEAMAAGLPVVVSDWDGYKDTVRDGVDGYRIPTLMPPAGLGNDLAMRHGLEIDSYDLYCGHACSLVAVDVQATTQALAHLFESPQLRRQMGQAGQQRARHVFDWQAIIPQYEALWDQHAEMRTTRAQPQDLRPRPQPWPARMDPFHGFAAYASHTLTPQSVLGLVDTDAATALKRTLMYRELSMVDFARAMLPGTAEIQTVFTNAATGPRTAIEILRSIPPARQAFVFRSLVWLVKLGVLQMIPPNTPHPGR